MPETGKIKRVSQGAIRIASVESDVIRVAKVQGNAPAYADSYTVTPSAQAQTLQTANKLLTDNIVVEPIPRNYGLITWNGSYLTVS